MAHLAGILLLLLLLYISTAPAQSIIIAPGETVCAHEDKPFLFFSIFFPSLLQHYIHTYTGMVTDTRPYHGQAAKNASCAFALSLFSTLRTLYTYFAADHRWQMANIDLPIFIYIYKHTHIHTMYRIYRYVGICT